MASHFPDLILRLAIKGNSSVSPDILSGGALPSGGSLPSRVVTLCLAQIVVVSVYHDVQWVWMAMAITCAITLALTLFSFQTKWDFTGWGPYIFAFHVVVIIFGFVAIIYWQTGRTSQILNLGKYYFSAERK